MKSVRSSLKRIPIVGPALHGLYLNAFRNEGEILEIKAGHLKGQKWIRFNRTYNDGYVRGDHELPLQNALAAELKPGMTFYDVGANGGFFTLFGATMVGPSGKVVAFEPHKLTMAQLLKQVSINGLSCVHTVEAAVCENIGTAEFSDDTYSDMASLAGAASAARTVTVKTTTLDHETLCRDLKPDVLKIDVEGAEIDALHGMLKTIEKYRPTLLVELHSDDIGRRYHSLMQSLSYETASVSGDRFVISKPR